MKRVLGWMLAILAFCSVPVVQAQNPQQLEARKQAIAQRLAGNQDVCEFFGLSSAEVKTSLSQVRLDDTGVSLSPMFQSPGYGRAVDTPLIRLSDLGVSDAILEHECRHALHYFLCCRFFEEGSSSERIALFRRMVLEDPGFRHRIAKNGFPHQKEMFAQAWRLTNRSKVDAARHSRLLGALTYQHAYFVAPGVCEAVASFGDRAMLKALDQYNRVWSVFIPGEDYLEGYLNKKWQAAWHTAPIERKCLLIHKSAFRRTEYFSEAR